jgi:VWFA-related protein
MNRWISGRPLLISVLTVLAASAPGSAATVGGPVHEQAGVSLVEVPVTVVDRDGKAVAGLTAADFELRDDGKPVTLQGVDVTTFTAREPAPGEVAMARHVESAGRRRFLLLFDLSFSSPVKIGRIRDAALQFIKERLTPDDLVAVATITAEHGPNLLVTFTPDRVQVAEAVTTLGMTNKGSLAPDPLKLTRLLQVLEPSTGDAGPQGGGRQSDPVVQEIQALSDIVRRRDDAYARGRVTAFLQSMASLARALDSVEGRKQVIYFSQGFDMRLLQGTAEDFKAAQKNAETAIQGSIWNVDSEERFGNSGLQTMLSSVLDQFKRCDCVIHTVDLSGLTVPGAGGGEEGGDPSNGNGRSTLFAIADGTGGETFQNANDFGGQLGRLLERQSIVYVLTFSPKLTGHPGKLHTLKAKVNRAGLRVSTRSAYVEPRPFDALSVVERSLSAADLLAAEAVRSEIPVQLFAYALPSASPVKVAVLVHAPSLPAANAKGKIPLEVYLYAFEPSGRIADFATTQGALDPERLGAALATEGVTIYSTLRLAPGEYRIRSLVRNSSTGAAGLTAVSLTVTAGEEKKPVLLPPVFVGSESQGVMLRATSARTGSTAAAEPYPFTAGKQFVPQAPAEYRAGADIPLCLYAYHLGSAGSNPNVQVWGDILDEKGATVGEASIVPGAHSRPDEAERSTMLITLKTAGLSPGAYRIRIGLNRENGEPIQSDSEFRLK